MTNLFKYNLSFTTGALYYHESLVIVNTYIEVNNWVKCKEIIFSKNLLQAKTISSMKKILNEIISRIKLLTEGQIKFIVNGSKQEQIALIWLAICKKYQFIKDFAIEVIREKFLTFDYFLTESDYTRFFNSKIDWHPELESITELTSKKIKQVLFRILREAEIIGKNNEILPSILSKELISEILLDPTINFSIFPISENTIQSLKNGIR